MKRRFVLYVDGATRQQANAVTQFLKEAEHVAYWHWLSDLWLVTDPRHKWTAKEWKAELHRLAPGSHKLVIQIDGDHTWSAFGNKKMFEWLRETWSKD